jgi:malate dehydrogenase (oxaloacetate-decarboxylating)(NADP+)
MEGKGVLFKKFADIDVFDIELKATDPEEFIKCVQNLEPTFGGINLEDIKSPECFYIEETLKKTMNIPVFHDDQHGTAIISGAGLVNAIELVKKDISKVKLVCNGAGAAAVACSRFYMLLGVKKENIYLCDRHGLIYKGRTEDMNAFKEEFANGTKKQTLLETMKGADVLIGLSAAGTVTKEMIAVMAKNPIVFAMANPDPEITYEDATSVRDDIIMATGRSDYPNQVNNVLGFPFIFRGALDVRAKAINDDMKLAAARALAALAKEDVPDAVLRAYGNKPITFGKDYIIPKPFDSRVLLWVAPAVAKAAMETGVARIPIKDFDEYRSYLDARLGKSRAFIAPIVSRAQGNPKRIVFPEGEHPKILRAAQIIIDENIAKPILLGDADEIRRIAEENNLDIKGVEIIEPEECDKFSKYADDLYKLRERRGLTKREAAKLLRKRNYFGAMMVRHGDADGLLSGLTTHYPSTIRPALQVIGMDERFTRVAGLYIIITKRGEPLFFADTTVNINPTAEELAEIALMAADAARRFNVEPRVALLSFSNFGSARMPESDKVRKAAEIVHRREPELEADGEMQADTAVIPEILSEEYSFSRLKKSANVLIFPNLDAGNIAYKLMMRVGEAEAIGPVLLGMKKPVHVLQEGCEVQDIVNMAAICVVEAASKGK